MILSAAHSSSTSAVRVISRRRKACQLRRRLADFCREGEWTARRLERRGRQELVPDTTVEVVYGLREGYSEGDWGIAQNGNSGIVQSAVLFSIPDSSRPRIPQDYPEIAEKRRSQ